MPANNKTIFKKAVAALKESFNVVEEADDKIVIDYGKNQIGVHYKELDGVYFNVIIFYEFKPSRKLKRASWLPLRGKYSENKRLMELFITSLLENVHFGCDMKPVENLMFDAAKDLNK